MVYIVTINDLINNEMRVLSNFHFMLFYEKETEGTIWSDSA